jgi:RNA polymerase sigma factor (sigma-70 family)
MVSKVLGSGGMGIVFQAEDPRTQKPVAIKVIKPLLALSETAKAQLVREANMMRGVRDPHVVEVYEVGELDGVPFIVMELLRGESLRERIHREGPLSPDETLRIGRDIALGLAAVHGSGVIHLDVKPSNLWIEEGTRLVKVIDLGLGRGIDEHQPPMVGHGVGTAAYMSPEQARGGLFDPRSDLFGLGCVLYETLTGALPFRGENRAEVISAVLESEPDYTSVPASMVSLIKILLNKDPSRRFASARDAAQAIDRLASELPHSASSVTAVREQPCPPLDQPSDMTNSLGSITRWIGDLKTGGNAARSDTAARQLWERYYHRINALARKWTSAAHPGLSASDVVQSAFISFFEGTREGEFPALDDRKRLWTLLITIALRKSLKQIGHHRASKRDYSRLEEKGSDFLDQLPGTEKSPMNLAIMTEMFQRMQDRLGDDDLRRVFLLRLEDHTNKEIAIIMNTTVRTVTRKLKKIAEIIGEMGEG